MTTSAPRHRTPLIVGRGLYSHRIARFSANGDDDDGDDDDGDDNPRARSESRWKRR